MSDCSDAEDAARSMENDDDDECSVRMSPRLAVSEESDDDVSLNQRQEPLNCTANCQLSSRATAFSIAALLADATPQDDDNDETELVNDVEDINEEDDDDDNDDGDYDDDHVVGDDDNVVIIKHEQDAIVIPHGKQSSELPLIVLHYFFHMNDKRI